MISIIIPVFNKEEYLKQCIESVIKQTYENIEIIIIDDGSTDDSFNIIKKYSQKDRRIIAIKKKNEGVSKTRNYGLNLAKGEYIAFVDADDWIEKDYLLELYKNRSDLTICSYNTINGDKRNVEHAYNLKFKSNEDIKNNILKKEYINLLVTPYLKLYKLDIIKNNNVKFDETMSFGEDTKFVLDYLQNCNNATMIKYNGYNNRIIEGTLSRKYINNIEEQCFYLNKKIFSFINNNNREYIYYWNLRNIKLVLYNEKGRSFKNIKKQCMLLKKDFELYKSIYFNFYDRLIISLLKNNMFYLLYLIYKIRR